MGKWDGGDGAGKGLRRGEEGVFVDVVVRGADLVVGCEGFGDGERRDCGCCCCWGGGRHLLREEETLVAAGFQGILGQGRADAFVEIDGCLKREHNGGVQPRDEANVRRGCIVIVGEERRGVDLHGIGGRDGGGGGGRRGWVLPIDGRKVRGRGRRRGEEVWIG